MDIGKLAIGRFSATRRGFSLGWARWTSDRKICGISLALFGRGYYLAVLNSGRH